MYEIELISDFIREGVSYLIDPSFLPSFLEIARIVQNKLDNVEQVADTCAERSGAGGWPFWRGPGHFY
jgi:hypothetical protein